jgi:hypothetical protein
VRLEGEGETSNCHEAIMEVRKPNRVLEGGVRKGEGIGKD